MRQRVLTAALALGGLALAGLTGCAALGGGEAAGSCAAPSITITSGDLTPGGELAFTAKPFADGCHDTGNGVDHPAKGLPVTLAVGGRTIDLGTVDAVDDGFRATGRFTLPADLPSGDGTLTVGGDVAATGDATTPITVVPAAG